MYAIQVEDQERRVDIDIVNKPPAARVGSASRYTLLHNLSSSSPYLPLHHTSTKADIGTTTLLNRLQTSGAITPPSAASSASYETLTSSEPTMSSTTRDTSLRIPIISHLPTALSPPPAPTSSNVLPRTPRRRQKANAARNGVVMMEELKPEDCSDTLTHGMRNLNISRDGSHPLEYNSSDTTTNTKKNRPLPRIPIESAKTAKTDHNTNELSPERQRVNGFTSRCSFIAPGIISRSLRLNRTQISAWSTDTSASSSSQPESLDSASQDSDNVFQATKTTISSPAKRPEYRVLLDNGLSIGCSMSSDSAYSMASTPNSPAAGIVAGKGSNHKLTSGNVGVNKWRRITAKEGTDDSAADAVDLTPRANRIRKRGEGLPLQESTDNILATPRRRARPWAIYQPSPTKKAKLSSLYLPHPDIIAKEKVKSSVPSGMITAPLLFRARDVPKRAESLPRRSEKGSLAEILGLDYRAVTAVKAGTSAPALPERRKHTSRTDGFISTVPLTRVTSTNLAKGLIPPLPPFGSDIKAAIDERFLQVRREEVSHGSSLAGKVSPFLTGDVSMGSLDRSLVCEAGSSTSGRSWVTCNPDPKPVTEDARNSESDTPTLSDDDRTLTPLMDSLLLTPDVQPHTRLPDPQPTAQAHQIKPRLHGLGLDIFPEEPIQLSVPRRWDATTWQHSFRRTEDYDDAMARFGAMEGKRQEAIWAFVKTEQRFVTDLQRLLGNVEEQIGRMMATRHAHTRTNALPRVRNILMDTLKIHRSFLERLDSVQRQQSPCVISVAAAIMDEIPALLNSLPYLMNRDQIVSIACLDVDPTASAKDSGGKMLAPGKNLGTLEPPIDLLCYSSLIKPILDVTPWSHPDRAASQTLFRKLEDIAKGVEAVMTEENLCDELFSGEFLLREVPADFYATRKSRKLVMHCDVAELSLQANSAGFRNRISGPRPPAANTESADVNKTGVSSANASLLLHYHRDSLITRATRIFVFTDCVCFGHRTMDTKILPPPNNNTDAATRETWCFDRTIGFLQPSSVHHREYPDFPCVLVIQAKPVLAFEPISSGATFATATNTLSTSTISLVPAGRQDRKLWSQLWNALKMAVAVKHQNKPLDRSSANSLGSERLHRSISFWLDRMDDVAGTALSSKEDAQATYFL